MCSEHQNHIPTSVLYDTFSKHGFPLRWFQDRPMNVGPMDRIRITDPAPIVHMAGDHAELRVLPWSWMAQGGRPVFNFRSEGRRFGDSDRCLIPSTGFYEFTAPEDPKQKKKDRWLFTMRGEEWFWIAGLIKQEAWTMLPVDPGPDVAPFHVRQGVVLHPDEGFVWLTLAKPEPELLRALPGGTFDVKKVEVN